MRCAAGRARAGALLVLASAVGACREAAPDPPAAVPSAPGDATTVAPPASAPPPRAARFDDDPRVRAACPADMALGEGDFCPVLPYACLAHSDELGYRCAEYARGMRCGAKPDPRRYCIDRHEWPNQLGAQPQVFVDWYEAK